MNARTRAVLVGGLLMTSLAACDDKEATPTVDAAPTPEATVIPSATATATPSATASAKPKIVCDPNATTITFNEPGLEAEIRKKVGKADGPITKDDLGKVKSVNLTQVEVNDLDPCVFPMLKSMKDLFVGKGSLEDLSPLAALPQLISLRATGNNVKDISPLVRMVHMDRLDLSHSQIVDITTISQMTELTELSLDDTQVTDLSPLTKCTKLEKVSIRNTAVKDLKPLAGAKHLKFLDVGGSPIEDTHVLDALTGTGLKIKTS
ncbi:MAG: leucine-rich repeat domain-containing protein [Polyangiaceae bacterium]